jgi:hypothetical protein
MIDIKTNTENNMKGQIRFILALFIIFTAVNLEGIVDMPTELTIAFVGIMIGAWGMVDSLERK